MPLDPADGYPYTPPTIAMAAGDERRQAYQFAVDIDIAMRRHYAQNLQRLSKTLYPFMYAEATSTAVATLSASMNTPPMCVRTSIRSIPS